jgi:hypothetical protein
MSRHVELEAIPQAWFDWENCSSAEKDHYRIISHRLVDESRAGSNVSRRVIAALAERYRAFRAAKEKENSSKAFPAALTLRRPMLAISTH